MKSSYKTYLPSQRFIQVVSVLILVLGTGGMGYLILKGEPEMPEDPSVHIASVRTSAKDRDGDGLKDWEESLWRTNIRNKDSDGDGVNDGDEVNKGTDPSIKGPDDKITSYQKKTLYSIPKTTSATNKTNNLINASLPDILELADRAVNGNPATIEEIQKIADKYPVPQAVAETVFAATDLNIQAKTSYLDYAKKLKVITDTYSSLLGDELNITSESLQSKDPNILLSVRSSALRYESLARDIIKTPVPNTLATEHLATANAYMKLSGVVLRLSSLNVDPLQGLVAIRDYQNISQEADTAFLNLFTRLGSYGQSGVQ